MQAREYLPGATCPRCPRCGYSYGYASTASWDWHIVESPPVRRNTPPSVPSTRGLPCLWIRHRGEHVPSPALWTSSVWLPNEDAPRRVSAWRRREASSVYRLRVYRPRRIRAPPGRAVLINGRLHGWSVAAWPRRSMSIKSIRSMATTYAIDLCQTLGTRC